MADKQKIEYLRLLVEQKHAEIESEQTCTGLIFQSRIIKLSTNQHDSHLKCWD